MTSITAIEFYKGSFGEIGSEVFNGSPIALIEINRAVVDREIVINGDGLRTQAYLAGAALSALRLVKLDSSNQLAYADNSTDATVLGLTFQAVSIGVAPITVLSGLVTDASWNWARGAPLFLGSNGQITASVPSSGFIVPIGNAEATHNYQSQYLPRSANRLMATNKFLTFLSNKIQLVTAIATSAGAGDANKIVSTGSDGLISNTFLNGFGPDTLSVVSSENLSSGDWVNVYDNAGTPNVRKADANPDRPCTGFVLAGTTSPAAAIVYRSGTNTALTGLTVGAYYYLSTTAGAGSTTAPTTATDIIQGLGFAANATSIPFQPTAPITVG